MIGSHDHPGSVWPLNERLISFHRVYPTYLGKSYPVWPSNICYHHSLYDGRAQQYQRVIFPRCKDLFVVLPYLAVHFAFFCAEFTCLPRINGCIPEAIERDGLIPCSLRCPKPYCHICSFGSLISKTYHTKK